MRATSHVGGGIQRCRRADWADHQAAGLRVGCERLLRAMAGRAAIGVLAVASVTTLLIISISPFPFSVHSIYDATGQRLLDVLFAYSVDKGMVVLGELGAEGRSAYSTYIAFDAVFACCYGALFAALMFRSMGASRFAKLAMTVPLVTAFADLAEGGATTLALSRFPSTPPAAIAAASTLGVVKHVGFWCSAVGVVLAAIAQRATTHRRVPS